MVLPLNLESIHESAFSSCINLRRINIPPKVTVIEKSTFMNCERLEEVVLSSQTEKIISSAFSGCKMLRKIDFPDTLVKIGSYAFSYCLGLTEIRIPQHLQRISEYAFSNCRNLEIVHFPDVEIPGIHEYAFKDCDKIIPQIRLSEKKYGELSPEELKFDADSCPISGEEFKKDMPIIILKCGHVFKKESLLEWIKIRNICPYCRKYIGF
jgi:hypothetical protein